MSPGGPHGCPFNGGLWHDGVALWWGCGGQGVGWCGSALGHLGVCVSGWGSGVGAGAPPHGDVTPSRDSSPHPATGTTGCWCCRRAVGSGCLHRLPARGGRPSPASMSGGAEGAAPLPQLNAVSTGHRRQSGDSWVSGCPRCCSACHAHCWGGRAPLRLAVPVPHRWPVPATAERALGDTDTSTCEGDRAVMAGVGRVRLWWLLRLWGTLGTAGCRWLSCFGCPRGC